MNDPVHMALAGDSSDEGFRAIGALLLIGCLYAIAGGYMDAYSYLAHGHVFANAQTGNVVFFGVYASGGQWAQAAHHLPPIIAFALGVAVTQLLGVRSENRFFRVTLLCQGFEVAVVTGLAAVGRHLPDACVVPILSFVAAIQTTGFDRIGKWPFNSAMTTGNIREATAGLVLWASGKETSESGRKAIVLSIVCLSFMAGAFCGGIVTRRDAACALAPCACLIAAAFLLTLRERRRRIRQAGTRGATS